MTKTDCEREYDFALVINGVAELTEDVMDALFEAGCDDATFSIQYGNLYAEFSRRARSFKDAVLTAIRDVHKAKIGASVVSVDACDLVTQADIARRIGRSRQLVFQYISGQRGPGNFPAPECHLSENAPLWRWCAVSYWLSQNNLIRPEESYNAQVIAAINTALEALRQRQRNPELVKEVTQQLSESSA